MILEPPAALDRLANLAIVSSHVLRQAGTVQGILAFLRLFFQCIPVTTARIIWTRLLTRTRNQTKYVRHSSAFEDFITRVLGWSALNLPTPVLRAATDRGASAQLIRWRAYRNGWTRYNEDVEEKTLIEGPEKTEGLWIRHDKTSKPDIVLYYMHGGGYAVLSAKYYLEFVLAFQNKLLQAGFKNPYVFSLDYSLSGDRQYPGQLHEATLGYKEVLREAGDDADTKIVIGGDSAGGMLSLTLLQDLAARKLRGEGLRHPDLAVLVSPWVTLTTHLHRPSPHDYIQPEVLAKFAREYTGGALMCQAPASPGHCDDEGIWEAAAPKHGYVVTYGEVEMLADDIRCFVDHQKRRGTDVRVLVHPGRPHVWPVLAVQLGNTTAARVGDVEAIANEVRDVL